MKIDFAPEKSLFSLPIVQWSASITFLLAIISTAVIAAHMIEIPWDFSGPGFNNFAIAYKVPAAFLAIGFTIIGLCGANHRSEQSRAQMRLAESQNIFSNHYKHIEEFEKYCTAISERLTEDFKTTIDRYKKNKLFNDLEDSVRIYPHIDQRYLRTVYTAIFPDSKNGSFKISEKFLRNLDENIIKVASKFNDIEEASKKNDIHGISNAIIDVHDEINDFADRFFIIDPDEGKTENFAFHTRRAHIPHNDYSFLNRKFIDCILALSLTLKFDVSHKESKVVLEVLGTQVDELDEYDMNNELLKMNWNKMNIYLALSSDARGSKSI